MALASNLKIQSAIREELEMHHVQQQHLEGGREEAGEGGLHAAEATVAQMESTVRRLLRRGVAGGEEDEEEEEGREGGRGSPGSERSSSSSFLTGSFELLGAMSAEWAQAQAEEEEEEEDEGKYDDVAENLPSNSFVSVGRNMRRKDSLAGEVSEEVLDELLRGDDDDDVITQKLFAETPDEQVRRYLRNLDLECVICCEYMVECKAVDCGEGHTFCGECIERWLGREGGHGGGGGERRCPTCQKPCGTTLIPMRQYDAMIEKYVRASNLWDEQCSFYRRRTLAHMRRELERQDREEEEAAAAAAAAGSQNPFVGLGNLLFGLGGPSGAAATRRRRRNRQAAAAAAAAAAATAGGGGGVGSARGEGEGAEDAAQPWWRSEVLSTALSVATMLVLLVLFKRGIKIR
jgi:hypothetical protein